MITLKYEDGSYIVTIIDYDNEFFPEAQRIFTSFKDALECIMSLKGGDAK